MAPLEAARFRRDLGTAHETVQAGVSSGRATAASSTWEVWVSFTTELGIDPFLEAIQDKVQVLQVFATRVRDGELSKSKNKIKSRSVEDYLRQVAQTYKLLGKPDPRVTDREIDFRISRMYRAYAKQDPPPHRVKPVPVQVLHRLATVAQHADPLTQGITDMIILAFFFLLRPGEYTDSNSDTTPFTLQDIQLFRGPARLDLPTASDAQLLSATFASLTFTDQKNGVRGEVIGHSRSGSLTLCPVIALARRVIHLRHHNARPSTPLARVFVQGGWSKITPTLITKALRQAVAFLGPELGFLSTDVSARCLRAAGATALLNSKVDSDLIKLLGRWHSDAMLRYLHLQSAKLMKNFASCMLTGGAYTLIPNQLVPTH